MLKSPITNSTNISLIRNLDTKSIIGRYLAHYKIDISDIIKDRKVSLYKCEDTGLHFFQPNSIAGDGKFYEQLQVFDWYYIPWKWEHEYCMSQCNQNDVILEIGCGSGGFMKEMTKRGYQVEALELNEKVVNELVEEGFNVKNQVIQDFAIMNEAKYDIVCSFQVLEHVADVKSFLEGAVRCLKPNGKLLIGVPNNDSHIKYNKESLLNLPPHHMGLWTIDSLKALEKYFGITYVKHANEPLQPQHFSHYYYCQLKKYFGYLIAAATTKLTFFIARPFIKMWQNNLIGEGIIVSYRKL